MQKRFFLLLFSLLFMLAGCGDAASTESSGGANSSENSEESTGREAERTPAPEKEAVAKSSAPLTAEGITEEMLQSFVPEGDVLMDWQAGDLNRDAYPDAVLITKDKSEDEESDMIDNPMARPVILLLGNDQNELVKTDQNNDVALCKQCGGVFGDPHDGIAIKNGYFSIEHYGGSNWRWTRIITFKYVEAEKTWYLHKDGGISYNTGNPDDMETNIRTVKDFGKVKFADFTLEDI